MKDYRRAEKAGSGESMGGRKPLGFRHWVAHFFALMLGLVLAQNGFAALAFTPGATLSEYANWSHEVVTADFNQDGRADTVVVSYNGGNFVPYLGNGSGGFTAVGPHFTTGTRPIVAAVGGFNGDIYPDLLISNLDIGTISVWTGDGDGSFTLKGDYSAPAAYSIAVADFNGDGRADFAVPLRVANQVRIYLGNGSGAFTPGLSFAVGDNPAGIAAADFNGDGDVDLAVANNFGNSINILFGLGTGFFVPSAGASPAINGAYYLGTGDFNEDGYPDLLASSTSGTNVYYLRGLGDGTFTMNSLSAGSESQRFAVADFDLDGHADFAVTNLASDSITVKLGNGDGTFAAAANVTPGDGPIGIASADFNGDGMPDLVVGNQLSNNARVLINAFTSPDSTLSSLTTSAGALAPAFSPATHGYSAFVPYSTTAANVTPTANEAHATITVNGSPLPSGATSGPIALVEGANAIAIAVTAQDGSGPTTYTLTVFRAPLNGNANLVGLELSSGTLAPPFASLTQWYTTEVPNSVASLTVTPTPFYAGSTITVNGNPVANGTASGPLALAVGANAIDVLVTAENSITTKNYHIDVTRSTVADDASLSALALSSGILSPSFVPGTTSYSASVGNGVASVTVTPTVSAAGATVTVNGVAVASGVPSAAIPLSVGSNTITVIGTSSSTARTMTYTLTVERAAAAATPPIVGAVPNQSAVVGTPFSIALAAYVTATEGDPILAYSLAGVLPPGLTFNTATGMLSGTPTVAGGFINLALSASDKDGSSNTDTFSIMVAAPQPQAAPVPVPVFGLLGQILASLLVGFAGLAWRHRRV